MVALTKTEVQIKRHVFVAHQFMAVIHVCSLELYGKRLYVLKKPVCLRYSNEIVITNRNMPKRQQWG